MNLSFDVSVIICTHNPRPDYLRRVLEALKAQTLPKEQWEMLLIDNASKEPLAPSWDLSWHPHARHIRENELGLTAARLRGIKETKGELLVFVDDDNLLAADYLRTALCINRDRPYVGAWGGQITPVFEEEPPKWTRPYWPLLGNRSVDQDQWSNLTNSTITLPLGAGMCVRRSVAVNYSERVKGNSMRLDLGRKGASLNSAEDWDLALTACDLGLATGVFKSLALEHLISPRRLSEDYLLRLSESISYTSELLKAVRNPVQEPVFQSSFRAALGKLKRRLTMHPRHWRIHEAQRRGQLRGMAEAASRAARQTPSGGNQLCASIS